MINKIQISAWVDERKEKIAQVSTAENNGHKKQIKIFKHNKSKKEGRGE